MARSRSKIIAPAWPELSFEIDLWNSGKQYIAGIDEAGRGAWAGPVTAAAVILPCGDDNLKKKLAGVRDSKQMTAAQRYHWAERIRELAVAASIGWADHQEIDDLGILPATRLAMERAVTALEITADFLLIDAVKLPSIEIPQTSLIKGDARSLSIAAASVLAKTARDHYMELLEEKFTGYCFDRHKGYGTSIHRDALASLGISPEHRKSYAPIRVLMT